MVLGLLRKILSNYDEVEAEVSVTVHRDDVYRQYELEQLRRKYQVATEAIDALEQVLAITTNARIAERVRVLLQDLRRARDAIEQEVAHRIGEIEALQKAKQFLNNGNNSG